MVDFFDSKFSFLKEAQFYTHIIPALELFERQANVPDNEKIDAFIRCFGCRLSLNPSNCLNIKPLNRITS